MVNNASDTAYTDIWYGMTKATLINVTKSFAKIYEEGLKLYAAILKQKQKNLMIYILKWQNI